MALEWKHSTEGVDWEELSALYRAAPLGDKSAAHLQKVFSNSMFKCFVYENTHLVAAGRALADGGDCAYICDIAVLPISIWQITHKGKLAYLFFAPCCDQYNPLYDASGEVLCHPSGGIHGRGDSTCPSPADRGTAVQFVWSHPQSPIKGQTIPALGQ